MDHGLIGSISTVLVFVTFIAIVWWAYSRQSKKNFEEAANLIFDDEEQHKASTQQTRESSTNE
ncbi:cbb3-type cytochrome c oxidase subunit 3 [Bowmanella sp. JS7-9]|jgi:cytochrome c oxidase cbb3-type subunit 4|uniref:Cbb3-type cytochrome oxidase subunit 3 n=1 Tax=Pseudobowmanella zhangzhouensis TaxID=1537679 RepID=A0ABW1XJI5_9ALTE|nr:cbb3-type cytochrome c oxidase subunit 3 [Bowmanella sp. JS7-9]TBX26030.1 hypothetical protein TK45_02155 [Bowmanella sp. JS7-9]